MRMTGKKLMVKQEMTPAVSKGGIVLTDDSIRPLPYGAIVGMGPDVDADDLNLGDVVLFNEIGAIQLGDLRPDHVLIETDDILAVLEEGDY